MLSNEYAFPHFSQMKVSGKSSASIELGSKKTNELKRGFWGYPLFLVNRSIRRSTSDARRDSLINSDFTAFQDDILAIACVSE